jgi:hypothetical protein
VTALVRRARLPRTIKRRVHGKAVLLALADRCDDDGRNAWPSVSTIAKEVEMGVRSVPAVLRMLEEAGIIHEQAPPSQHRPRTWSVDLARLQELSDLQDLADLNQGERRSDLQHVADLSSELCSPDLQHAAGLASDPERPGRQNRESGRQNRESGRQNRESGRQICDSGRQHVAEEPVLLNCPLNSPLNSARAQEIENEKHRTRVAVKAKAIELLTTVGGFSSQEALGKAVRAALGHVEHEDAFQVGIDHVWLGVQLGTVRQPARKAAVAV